MISTWYIILGAQELLLLNVSWGGRSGDLSAAVNSLCSLGRSLDLAGFRFLMWKGKRRLHEWMILKIPGAYETGQITIWPGSREEKWGTRISAESKSLGESWKTCLDPGLRMSWKEAAFPEDNRTTRLARGYLAQPKVWHALNHPSATCMVSFRSDRPQSTHSVCCRKKKTKTNHSPRSLPSVMTAIRKWVWPKLLCSL